MIRKRDAIASELLAIRCRRGEPAAFEDLVNLWEKRLFYYIRRLVENEEDAWDALQQTWFQVSGNLKNLREPAALPAWLYRIARNAAMGLLRKRSRRQEVFVAEDENLENVPDEVDPRNFADAERVHHGLSKVSPSHREVLTLFFLDDLSLREIAGVLGVPEGTVKSRLHKAKHSLRNVLEREDRQDER